MLHDHSHHQELKQANVNSAFIAGIILNLAFVVIEIIAGFYNNSLSLLSDAGHNLMDVGALGLSLLAFRMLRIRSKKGYTYGYRKISILVSLFNAVLLLISIGIIMYEAARRLFHPVPVSGINISIVASAGIVINFVSARLFLKNKEEDINIRSAYLHLMSDAAVSVGIVAGGILLFYLKWLWLDPLISIVIALVILASTWHLLTESLRLSLDGVPQNIDVEAIRAEGIRIEGVKDLHHIHIWAISSTENALTAHLVLSHSAAVSAEEKIKQQLKHLLEHKNIHHITLETERQPCDDTDC